MSVRYFLSRQNIVRTVILLMIVLSVGAVALYINQRDVHDVHQVSHTPKRATALPAPSWFVAPDGDDTNTGKRADRPLASIQKALEQAQPGDAVKLADGTYRQSFHTIRDGTSDKPITILGSQKVSVMGSQSRIIEINHDYIRLTGFVVDGHHSSANTADAYRDKLIYVIGTKPRDGVEGLQIDHMLIQNAGGECMRLRYFAKDNEIADNTIKNCGAYDFKFNDGGKNGEGIYIGTAPEQLDDGKNPDASPDESSGNWVHNNYIETNGNECVDVKEAAHDNLVEHNECTGQRDPESGGLDARGEHNTFRYNNIHDNTGAGVRLGGDEDDNGTDNNVYSNTIRNNQGYGMKILRGPQGDICSNKFSGNNEGEMGGEFGEDMSPNEKCDM
jgi:hypothetical protein